ncbi:hypothetical protein [Brevundimonas sp.]
MHHEAQYASGMQTPADRLRQAREQAKYPTAKAAAEAMGVPVATYIQHENGSRGYPAARADRYGRFFRVAPEWLLYARGESDEVDTTDSVPIVGYVSAGAALVRYGDGQGPFDYVPAPRISTPTTVGAAVEGVSLGPAFDHAVIFYDDVRSPVTEDLHGRLCIVGLDDERVLVKILRPAQDGLYHLISNSVEEPLLNQRVMWAAKVTEIRPR